MMYLNQLPTPDLTIWTDGSVYEGTGTGGAGIFIEFPTGKTWEQSAPAGVILSSCRAEFVAIREGLRILEEEIGPEGYAEVRIYSDSQAALKRLAAGPSAQTDDMCNAIWSCLRRLAGSTNITMAWVPGHCYLEGNEEADRLANEGRRMDQVQCLIDLTTAKSAIRRHVAGRAEKDYLDDPRSRFHISTTSGKQLKIKSMPKEIPLAIQTSIRQLRVGCVPICRSYLNSIGKADSPLCPHCGVEDYVSHLLLYCVR